MTFRKAFVLFLSILILGSILPTAVFAANENLALRMPYIITEEAKIEHAYPNLVTDDPNAMLTDGKTGGDSISSKAWLSLYRGIGHSIVVDLGAEKNINGVSIGFLSASTAGIYAPNTLSFAFSKDGENFGTVYQYENFNEATNNGTRRLAISFSGNDYYAARYVRISFKTSVFNYVDEIEVTGTSDSRQTKEYALDETETYVNAFPAPESLGGISNLVLIYNSEYYGDAISNVGKNTYDELLPYVAYLDKTKKSVTDTMFDSFLFLPLNPGTAGKPYSFTYQTGWESYLKNTIGTEEKINLTALDQLVGDVKTQLGLESDLKYSVIMTMPYIAPSSTSFGKLDGDTSVVPNTQENRTKIIQWFADKSTAAFEEANFANLSLAGFYWYQETIPYGNSNYEEDLVRSFNEIIHKKNLLTTWIPYYCSAGSEKWKEFGFDAATLQSGYAFPHEANSETGAATAECVEDSMSFAMKYGMGVELEVSMVSDVRSRYSAYVSTSASLGCMQNGISMLYQGGGPGDLYNGCYAASSDQRYIYDLTYQYLKKSYNTKPPAMDGNPTIVALKNISRNNGKLPFSDEDSLLDDLKILDLTQPEHGQISLDGDGYFIYSPNDDYVGKDSFSFRISDGVSTTEVYTVQVLVVEDALNYDRVNATLRDGIAVLYNDYDKETTGTEGDTVYEVIVSSEGIVTFAGYKANNSIPQGGYILSGMGEKADWLRENAAIGKKAVLDTMTRRVIFTDASEQGASEAPQSSAISSGSDGKNVPYLWIIIAAVAVLGIAVAAFVIIKKNKTKKEKKTQ